MPAPDRSPARGGPLHRLVHRRVPGWSVPIIVVAVVLAAELGARWIGPNLDRSVGAEERLLIKSDQIAERGDVDLVAFGSSDTAGGFLPGVVEEGTPFDEVYNAGLAGSEVRFMHEWADRVVVPRLQPDVAVIGLLPMSVQDLDAVAEGSAAELAPEQAAAIDAYRSALDQVDPEGPIGGIGWDLRQRSALVRWRPYLRSPSTAVEGLATTLTGGTEVTPDDLAADATMDWTTETDPARIARNTADDGEVLDYRQPSAPVEADPVGAALYARFGEAPVDLDELAAFVASLRAQGVQPVIALSPVDRTTLEAGGADLAPLDAVAAQVVAWGEANDVPVDDQFTQDWAPALFHDRNHLDEAGAQAWSRSLATWLDGLCSAGELGDAC